MPISTKKQDEIRALLENAGLKKISFSENYRLRSFPDDPVDTTKKYTIVTFTSPYTKWVPNRVYHFAVEDADDSINAADVRVVDRATFAETPRTRNLTKSIDYNTVQAVIDRQLQLKSYRSGASAPVGQSCVQVGEGWIITIVVLLVLVLAAIISLIATRNVTTRKRK